MSKESGESRGDLPLFGRKKRTLPEMNGLSGNVVNLERAREARLAARVTAIKTILDRIMEEPHWKLVEHDEIMRAIAQHKDSLATRVSKGIAPGDVRTQNERLMRLVSADEVKLKAAPLEHYALIELLEKRGLISPDGT